MFKLVFPTI